MKQLIKKLDLSSYIEDYENYLARSKPLFLEGDRDLHFRYIKKISMLEFNSPPPINNLDQALAYLKKQGHLKLSDIFSFIQIIRYFNYLKKLNFDDEIREYLQKIVTPEQIYDITLYFDEKGRLQESIDERFVAINQSLKRIKEEIKSSLNSLLRSQKLSPFLVDSQIHYIDDSETLLLRGGFNQVIKGTVLKRSSGGFFYLHPKAISDLKEKETENLSQKDAIIFEYEKKISTLFYKYEKFLSFINKEFDRFDHYQARINFAKSKELEFIKPSKSKEIKLKDFSHPALSDPKPISIDFSKKILMITGVNAGGKTMLLKSILASVFLAKYLLPMKIDASKSTIANYKFIEAIIDDPQSVKNDISTFAGRMREFSKLFSKNSFIAGVDEIELGTDSDEAATLFSVILEELSKKDAKVIITTHHKRLASMMAKRDEVELLAAIYDEKRQRPTYQFLSGTIGKSYAFETAQRYGIPNFIIDKAFSVYGKDKEKLNDLIQKNIDLELALRSKLQLIKKDEQRIDRLKTSLKEQKEAAKQALKEQQNRLESSYKEAIDKAKEAAKQESIKDIHKDLNKASKLINKARDEKILREDQAKEHFQEGDFVRYKNQRGKIISIKKKEAFIESDGFKLRVPLSELKRSSNPPKRKTKTKITLQKPTHSFIQLDLHGLRSEEAIERLDIFLSNALISGFDEVLIYHGIGTGKLAFAVKEFLKSYPKVKSFSDAPANQGGMGATIVRL